jgi:hypothetical protein
MYNLQVKEPSKNNRFCNSDPNGKSTLSDWRMAGKSVKEHPANEALSLDLT